MYKLFSGDTLIAELSLPIEYDSLREKGWILPDRILLDPEKSMYVIYEDANNASSNTETVVADIDPNV